MITQTEVINRIVTDGAGGMTHRQFLEIEIRKWKDSKKRESQLLGRAYYEGLHEISERQRMVIGKEGQPEAVRNLPNNRIVDNQFAKMVDQKTNYLLGKPIDFATEDKALEKSLKKAIDKRFSRVLRNVCKDALIGAIGWLHPYYSETGRLCLARFAPEEVLPFWADYEHTVLDSAIRLYERSRYDGFRLVTDECVDEFTREGVQRYVLKGGVLEDRTDGGGEAYTPHFVVDGEARMWGRVPLIAFKYNEEEIPLISRVKSLQDALNVMLSDFMNQMQEDSRNTVLVIKNYDGQDLGEFRRNIATYGAVKVINDNTQQGDVETLSIEVNAANFASILETIKAALIENAKGYDAKDERMKTGQANQMNIQSMYADIDLDANGMETEFQAALEELVWYVYAKISGKEPDPGSVPPVDFIFNRDMLINESEAITNCRDSVGIISNRTIVANHPFTRNVEDEMKQIEKEKQEALEAYGGAFPQGNDGGDADEEEK